MPATLRVPELHTTEALGERLIPCKQSYSSVSWDVNESFKMRKEQPLTYEDLD